MSDGCRNNDGEACACKWASIRNKAPLEGLSKAAQPDLGTDTCTPGDTECAAVSATAAACEAWCCSGGKDGRPPVVTDAPADQPSATGPCGSWQWKPGETALLDGCWVGVQGRKLPWNADGGGLWVGAEGSLGTAADQWGVPFLTALGVCAVVWVGGGLAYTVLTGRGRSGFVATGLWHPHSPKVRQFIGLVKDGIAFARGSAGGRALWAWCARSSEPCLVLWQLLQRSTGGGRGRGARERESALRSPHQ